MPLSERLLQQVHRLGGKVGGKNSRINQEPTPFDDIFRIEWPSGFVYANVEEDPDGPTSWFNPEELDFANANGRDAWGTTVQCKLDLVPYFFTCHGQMCFFSDETDPSDPRVVWFDEDDDNSIDDWTRADIRLSHLLSLIKRVESS